VRGRGGGGRAFPSQLVPGVLPLLAPQSSSTCPPPPRHTCSLVFQWPSLELVATLSGATEATYAALTFCGSAGVAADAPDAGSGGIAADLLASVGSAPDYLLTLWDWKVRDFGKLWPFFVQQLE